MIEGHHGSILCLECLKVALSAQATGGEKYKCTLCLRFNMPPELPHWSPFHSSRVHRLPGMPLSGRPGLRPQPGCPLDVRARAIPAAGQTAGQIGRPALTNPSRRVNSSGKYPCRSLRNGPRISAPPRDHHHGPQHDAFSSSACSPLPAPLSPVSSPARWRPPTMSPWGADLRAVHLPRHAGLWLNLD